MAVRLEPQDEYMHDAGDEPLYNESMYFNFYDPEGRLGGFFRIGNRPNEHRAEVTACCYLPDGRIGFMFGRPEIDGNEAFAAGGMSFSVTEPFKTLEVAYSGTLLMLDEPLQMAHPERAFNENPTLPAEVRLSFHGAAPMFGGESDVAHERPGEEFARAHYEQLVHAVGTVKVGERDHEVNGYGLRDHSWGKRTWQAPWYYRWLTGNAGPDFGFMASRVARRDGDGIRGGFVYDEGELHLCDRLELATDWVASSGSTYHAGITATLGSGDRSWSMKGRVINLIPLRNRRTSDSGEELVTRISEGLTEWTLANGRIGHGLSEYLDQIVDGKPVGLAE